MTPVATSDANTSPDFKFEPAEERVSSPATHIEIPKLGLYAEVVQYAGPGTEMPVDNRVVQSAYGPGNEYVAMFGAHQDGYTQDTQQFRGLDALDYHDEIILHTDHGRDIYYVASSAIMKPEVWAEIVLPKRPQVVLVTCWPYRLNTHRLVVIARLVITGLEYVQPRELMQAGLVAPRSAAAGLGPLAINDSSPTWAYAHNPVHTGGKSQDTVSSIIAGRGAGSTEGSSDVTQAVAEAVAPVAMQSQRVAAEMSTQQAVTAAAAQQQTNAALQNTAALGGKLDTVIDVLRGLPDKDEMSQIIKTSPLLKA